MNQIVNCDTVSHYAIECFMPKCHSDTEHNSDLKMKISHSIKIIISMIKYRKNNAAASSKLSACLCVYVCVCVCVLYFINIFHISCSNALFYIYIFWVIIILLHRGVTLPSCVIQQNCDIPETVNEIAVWMNCCIGQYWVLKPVLKG
jgi:hypothetical protein